MEKRREGPPINETLNREEKEQEIHKTGRFSEAGLDFEARDAIANKVEAIIADPDKYIDSGGAGDVYRLSEHSLCIKILKPHKSVEERKTGNDFVAREANITSLIAGHEVEGVRTPSCFGFFKSETDGRSGMILEELDAVNLQKAINGTVDFPEGFNKNEFMDALYAFIESMHETFSIVHADLYARNVMIDKTTGKPRVIDFGESASVVRKTTEQREALEAKDFSNLDEIDDILEGLTKTTK